MSVAHGRLRCLLQEGWMSVPAKYYWYVRSPTLCTRYGEPWRLLSMPRGMRGAFCHMGAQWRLQYCRHKCRRLQYCLCQGDSRALFLQAYRVWSLVSWFDLCAAFSVRPWFLPSGRPRSDGPSQSWSHQSEKSGKQASYGPLVGNVGSE